MLVEQCHHLWMWIGLAELSAITERSRFESESDLAFYQRVANSIFGPWKK